MDPEAEPTPTASNSHLGHWWSSLSGPLRVIVLLIAALAVLLLVLIGYTILNPQDSDSPINTSQTTPAPAEVSITKDGLDAATITIEAGTQLTWINNDDQPHQVAADPHPLENSINGFDGQTVLQPGDSLSFTFETAGTYAVHDHLNYLDKRWQGTVIVE